MSNEIRIETLGPVDFVRVALYSSRKTNPSDVALSLFGEMADEAL